MVFLDPDNGISRASTCGPKHVHFAEIASFFQTTNLLVVYQHLDRSKLHDLQVDNWLVWLHEKLGPEARCFAIRFRRGTSRAFLVAAKGQGIFDKALSTVRSDLATWIARSHFDQPRWR